MRKTQTVVQPDMTAYVYGACEGLVEEKSSTTSYTRAKKVEPWRSKLDRGFEEERGCECVCVRSCACVCDVPCAKQACPETPIIVRLSGEN